MILFQSDYLEGAHPLILKKLEETNFEQTEGYGVDPYCESARQKLRKACGDDSLDVHFLVGGTQTNFTVISSVLRPHQGVVSADTGHINVHETGAVEATGHKVLPIPSGDGKITTGQVRALCEEHRKNADREHMVQPGMVYISQPTENGTLYSAGELKELYETCREFEIPLFMDGARLGYGLMSEKSDLTLEEVAKLTDVFFVGGTKVGTLFGEAVVISHPAIKKDFRYIIKQRGGMLAKGRLLGIQFDVLFTDGLYFKIAKQADELAMEMKKAFLQKGYGLRYDSYTNQQFPILPDMHLERLAEKYSFAVWGKTDAAHTAVRFCTSWATRKEDVCELIKDIVAL